MYASDIVARSQSLAALLGFLLKKLCLRKQLCGFHTMVSKWEKKKTSCNRIPEADYVVKEGGSRL